LPEAQAGPAGGEPGKDEHSFLQRSDIKDQIDIAVIDASFISLKLVVPAVIRLIANGALILALIKPQFEAGRGEVGKKGVIRTLPSTRGSWLK